MEGRWGIQRPTVRCHPRKRRRFGQTAITIPRQRTDLAAGNCLLTELSYILHQSTTRGDSLRPHPWLMSEHACCRAKPQPGGLLVRFYYTHRAHPESTNGGRFLRADNPAIDSAIA